MIRGERAIAIACPPAVVFDYLADMRNLREWNPRTRQVEKLSEGRPRAGTRFRSRHRNAGWVESELIACERPRRLLILARGRRLDLLAQFRLEPLSAGTALRIRLEARPHRLWRLLAPLIVPRFRRENTKLLQELKRVLEARSAPVAAAQCGGNQ
ncbi:MAG TPA: SRPBCC family protein [Dehalococcoidia bacterium]|nr:SRPBCC family protein [Dehalococcoidia bacterium]